MTELRKALVSLSHLYTPFHKPQQNIPLLNTTAPSGEVFSKVVLLAKTVHCDQGTGRTIYFLPMGDSGMVGDVQQQSG